MMNRAMFMSAAAMLTLMQSTTVQAVPVSIHNLDAADSLSQTAELSKEAQAAYDKEMQLKKLKEDPNSRRQRLKEYSNVVGQKAKKQADEYATAHPKAKPEPV